jgi:hypothetical protein
VGVHVDVGVNVGVTGGRIVVGLLAVLFERSASAALVTVAVFTTFPTLLACTLNWNELVSPGSRAKSPTQVTICPETLQFQSGL